MHIAHLLGVTVFDTDTHPWCCIVCTLSQVFAPASEPHLLLLSDSAVRAAEAAAAGGPEPTVPEDTQQLRVHQLVRVRDLPVLALRAVLVEFPALSKSD
jgi:hypothetical protein